MVTGPAATVFDALAAGIVTEAMAHAVATATTPRMARLRHRDKNTILSSSILPR
jgi:hypothetical protein